MHDGQVEVPLAALREAIANQIPELADQPVRPVPSAGTVVAPFRVGDGFVARVPLVPNADPTETDRIRSEGRHARQLAEVLRVTVAHLVGVGSPFAEYPGAWSVWTWLPGRSLDRALPEDSGSLDMDRFVDDLAHLLRSVRELPSEGAAWSHNGRGGRPLADSEWIRTSIARSRHLIDHRSATHVWETALAAPAYEAPPVRIHGDPMPGNLLVSDGRLTGMIDVSEPVVGDPASDLQPAWEIFDEPQRGKFREAMGLDEAAWQRGRGWAFEMAIGGLHYYEHSNPIFFQLAERTLNRLLQTA